ncbi:hypothetical protein [Pseudolysinimonas yzui]|nr:hypothetical protein [Pseudolysinimonas yzui]
MANPRVHEVAAAAGVDPKIALRVLQDMGEFVKSASSSIPPPVARRLRANLDGTREITLPMTQAAVRAFERLPAGLPLLVEELLGREADVRRTLSVLRAAVPSRFLLHVGPAAAAALASRIETTLTLEDLVEPRGVVALRTGAEALLLSWRLSDVRLELSLIRVESGRATVVERGRADILNQQFVAVGRDEISRSLAVLARIPHVVPVRMTPGPADIDDVTGRPGSPTLEPDVRIVYLSRTVGDPSGLRSAVLRMSRWIVRGHWRNQWYPSTSSHHRIWISEHESGNPDAPVRIRCIVYALR